MKKLIKATLGLCLGALLVAPVTTENTEATTKDSDFKNRGVILPNQQRVQISNTTENVYPAVSFINVNNNYASASGVVIGKNTILTNKHVANNARSLKIYPGANGEGEYPFGEFEAEDYRLTPTGDDLAVVHLHPNENGQSIGDVVKPVKLGDASSVTPGEKIEVTGYPGDKPLATMWESYGSVTDIQRNVVRYNASTVGGNSGSPVFNSNDELVAVHYGGTQGMFNNAVLLTPEIKSFVQSQVR